LEIYYIKIIKEICKKLNEILRYLIVPLIDIIISYAKLSLKDKLLYSLLYSNKYELSIPIMKNSISKQKNYLYIKLQNENNMAKLEKIDIIIFMFFPNFNNYTHICLHNITFDKLWDKLLNKTLCDLGFYDIKNFEYQIENFIEHFKFETCDIYPFII